MQAYGHKRCYRIDNEIAHDQQSGPRKQAPKCSNSARRKSARQEARNAIRSALPK